MQLRMYNIYLISKSSRPKPSAPPIPNEEDTLQFFDAVIASCDQEPSRKPHVDNGHADVDFIGECGAYYLISSVL